MKPNPVGIKNFLCATADGIVLDFDLYQGTGALLEQAEQPEGLGLGGSVMARPCQTLHRGTKVYCDSHDIMQFREFCMEVARTLLAFTHRCVHVLKLFTEFLMSLTSV